jgi:type II secretory pathway pseudopilin PulG
MLLAVVMERYRNTGTPDAAGHTLLELVTVVALIAVAAALSYPAVAGMRRGQELERGAIELVHTLRQAHWIAVTTGRRVRLVTHRDEACRWWYGLEREAPGGWVGEGGQRALPGGALLGCAGTPVKVFNPDGTCSFGSLSVRGPGAADYRITLAPATGRVRFYRGDREAGRGR